MIRPKLKRQFAWLFIVSLTFLSCQKENDASVVCNRVNFSYYSDYFVFVADDASDPLVIPIDLNWRPVEGGYEIEFKGWYGTTKEWPIAYHVDAFGATPNAVPQESWEHANTENFQFDRENRQLILNLPDQPEIKLFIPAESTWVGMPTQGDRKEIYGMRSSVEVNGSSKNGWMVYERIRRDPSVPNGQRADFTAFFWIPIVVDGAFYHFEHHGDDQTATRWWQNGGVVAVDSAQAFDFTITQTSVDSMSGRTDIPEALQLQAHKWNLDIQLQSGGAQIGYGPIFPKGRAYYRQSLLQASDSSIARGYGMLELILEND